MRLPPLHVDPAPQAAGELPHDDLSARTIRAGRWRASSLLAQATLQFVVVVALARLLSPEDFGLAALAMVVVGFVGMVAELGLGAAVVYRRPLTARHVRVAFTVSMVAAIVLGGLLYAAAPIAARLLRNEAATGVLRAETVLFLFIGLGTTARALLRRDLLFRHLFAVEAGSYVLGNAAVAVTLALLGWGVWSLVLGLLTQALLSSAIALAITRHPVRPLLAAQEGRELLHYGGTATLNSMVSYAAGSVDSFVVGRWLGTAELGLYNRAFNLIVVPLSYLGSLLTTVLFPAMSEIRHDPARLRTAYLFGVQLTGMIAGPLCAGMLVAAPHLVVTIYGPKWIRATQPLQILATVGTLRAIYHMAGSVTYASGNVMAEVRRQALLGAVILGGGVLGTRWGLGGVALAVSAGIVAMYLAMGRLSLRIVGGTWGEFFAAHLPGAVLACQIAVIAFVVEWMMSARGVSSPWIVVAVVLACAAALPAGIYWLPRRCRPADLFARFSAPVSRLPTVVRVPVARVLRLET